MGLAGTWPLGPSPFQLPYRKPGASQRHPASPTEGITIIALTNRNEGEPIELVDSLAQRMLVRR
jgi:hypothetical protein